MSYKSPIMFITGQITSELIENADSEVLRIVQSIGVDIDREELIRAIAYDRGQYEKGYADRGNEIVRCEDCRNGTLCNGGTAYVCEKCVGSLETIVHPGEWYCADGEKRTDK